MFFLFLGHPAFHAPTSGLFPGITPAFLCNIGMICVERGQEEGKWSLAGDLEGAVGQEASLLWPQASLASVQCHVDILSSCDSGWAPCQAQCLSMSTGLLPLLRTSSPIPALPVELRSSFVWGQDS